MSVRWILLFFMYINLMSCSSVRDRDISVSNAASSFQEAMELKEEGYYEKP